MRLEEFQDQLLTDAEFQKTKQKMQTLLDLADRVLDLRLENGWTQAELARRAGTKQANISMVENGMGNPTIRFLEKVAQALGANLVVRLERKDNQELNQAVIVHGVSWSEYGGVEAAESATRWMRDGE